ncbi:MAG: YfiR family protein [Chromatiales bacterium]|nr:YfiR family protein [Chromatiales bacterium]
MLCIFAMVPLAEAAPSMHLRTSAEEEHVEKIEAIFLYQFGAYVEWPEGTFKSNQEPLLIGILDSENVVLPLENIVLKRRLRDRAVAVRRMTRNDDPRSVHIFFVGTKADPEVARAMIGRVRGYPVLTVAESSSINPMVTFVRERRRVRFDVSLAQAEECGLRISSRLLSVARQVIGSRP